MPKERSASQQIDAIIKQTLGWRGTRLGELRAVILEADSSILEEVKWKMPSKPSGVPVWSHQGVICVADTLKNAVRLTFPKGAQIDDPKKLLNTRLDSKTVRAVDYFEDTAIDAELLKKTILEAVRINESKG